MPHYVEHDDLLTTTSSSSSFLAPSKTVPRRSSRQGMNSRRSSVSPLAPSRLAHSLDQNRGDEAGTTTLNGSMAGGSRQHSLAHELAFALMPEPSVGSKLLAEEFGIEYDEGAEGIDEPAETTSRVSRLPHGRGQGEGEEEEEEEDGREEGILHGVRQHAQSNGRAEHQGTIGEVIQTYSFADELNHANDVGFAGVDYERTNGLGSPGERRGKPTIRVQKPEVDAMETLAQDLESTEVLLKHLRTLDSDPGMTTANSVRTTESSHLPSHQHTLERYASDIIRRMDEAARNREGQLRILLEYDREFRKIAGEANGTEVLSRVDELPPLDDDSGEGGPDFSTSTPLVTPTATSPGRTLDAVVEEDQTQQNEWDMDPHAHLHNDVGEDVSPCVSLSPSPTKTTFPPLPSPPPMPPPSQATPGSAIPHLTHIRTFTSSLIASLTTLSEQAQVNGAATTEAGRKIKALKNKMGGWQMDWESAEKSKLRIERWEAGIVDLQNKKEVASGDSGLMGSTNPGRLAARRRVDGRKLVEEYLNASEKAIKEATERTQAIMAR